MDNRLNQEHSTVSMKKWKTNCSVLIFFFFALSISENLNAQYQDYIGAGHDEGILVSSSSNNFGTASNTINGNGLDFELFQAGRFLAQTTFGSKLDEIKRVVDIGEERWFNEQTQLPIGYLTPTMDELWDRIYNKKIELGEEPEDIFGPYSLHFNYAWWRNMMLGPDQLRQRMAYALSQILVISADSNLGDDAETMTVYYDLLLKHAFGNYKDLLLDVTTNISMGFYLSHLNNPKEDIENNVHPDENYAREIMQLFSIGLYELNLDGTRILDANGDPIPTYDNDDIKELAQVFTGLGPGGINMYVDWTDEPYFGLGLWGADKRLPMVMYEDWHDQSEKVLLKRETLAAGQGGMADIEDAVTFLFNHQNVAPFLSRQLIQRFVKSNPSKEYIARVASVFNNNGQGTRGDLKAVLKAILFDHEARSCEAMADPAHGKLREPILKYTQLVRTSEIDNETDNFWNAMYFYEDATGQIPLHALSVFNFYLPDHQPVGQLSNAGLSAPEFKLHDTRRSVGYINEIHARVFWGTLFYSWEEDVGDEPTYLNTEAVQEIAGRDTEEMLNYYDIVLSNGQLTDETRASMRTAVNGFTWGDLELEKVRMALYLMMISPDYNIFK